LSYGLDYPPDSNNNGTLNTHPFYHKPVAKLEGHSLNTKMLSNECDSEGIAKRQQEAMQLEKAMVVSNGLFMKGAGATAWMIEGDNKDDQCMGNSLSPGDLTD